MLRPVPDDGQDLEPAHPGSAPLTAEEGYRRLAEAVDLHGMILLDPQGRITAFNIGAERLKGYAAEEVVGRHLSLFYPPEAIAVDHPSRELEVAAIMGRYEEEGWRVRKDGSRFWARVLILALHDEAGELRGFGKVTSDLTADRQRAEQVANTMRLLEQSIRVDGLTGLPNRRAWDERLAEELARAARTEAPLTVAMIDLDHFKVVNDVEGHAAGDRLLKHVGLSWRRVLRPTDVLARYGGEEFAVALPDCDVRTAAGALERLRTATPRGRTCSIGAAELRPGESGVAVLGRADHAMYAAKASGRDRLVVA